MSPPATLGDGAEAADRLVRKLDGVRDELVVELRHLRADLGTVHRQTLVTLTVFMSILNGITFTAYAIVLAA